MQAIATKYDPLRSNRSDNELEVSAGTVVSCKAWNSYAESGYIGAFNDTIDFKRRLTTVNLPLMDIPALADLLKSPKSLVRFAAAYRLGCFGTAQAIMVLNSAVEDPDLTVRKEIIDALASASNDAYREYPNALQTLIRIATEPSTDDEKLVQTFAVRALSRLPDVASRLLMDRLHKAGNSDVALFQTAAMVFSELKKPSTEIAKELIDRALDATADIRIRICAVNALGALRAREAAAALISVLNTLPTSGKYDWLGVAVTVALGRLGDKCAIEPIVHDCKRSYGTVAAYAIPRIRHEALCSLTSTDQYLSGDGWAA